MQDLNGALWKYWSDYGKAGRSRRFCKLEIGNYVHKTTTYSSAWDTVLLMLS